MKKNKLALISLMMAFVLLITACNSSGGSGGGNTSSSSGNNSSSSSGGSARAEVVMAYLNFGDATDVQSVEDEINKISREKINVVVDLMPIDIAAWQQQTNLMLAGNEKVDLIMSSAFFNYSTQVSRGQLLELDDLLEQYGQDIKGTMPEAIYNGTRINGKRASPSTRLRLSPRLQRLRTYRTNTWSVWNRVRSNMKCSTSSSRN